MRIFIIDDNVVEVAEDGTKAKIVLSAIHYESSVGGASLSAVKQYIENQKNVQRSLENILAREIFI